MSTFLISRIHPARITIYESSRHAGALDGVQKEFKSLDAMADFFFRKVPQIEEKRDSFFYVRGRCEGRRLIRNIKPPYLVVLDIDESKVKPDDCSGRLAQFDVDHLLNTTWSHRSHEKIGHSYRVITDHLCDTWGELRTVTEQLVALVGMKGHEDPASYKSAGFYVPAFHPARLGTFEKFVVTTAGSTWRPVTLEDPVADERKRLPAAKVQDLDIDELRSALAVQPNEMRQDWYEMGCCLHAGEFDEARELWDEWSMTGPGGDGYDAEDQEKTWNGYSNLGDNPKLKIGTIYWRAEHIYKWKRPRRPATEVFASFAGPEASTPGRVEPPLPLFRGDSGTYDTDKEGNVRKNLKNAVIAVTDMNLGLRYDAFADRVMMTGDGYDVLAKRFPCESRSYIDSTLTAIRWQIHAGQLELGKELIHEGVMTLAQNASYNPVVDYLLTREWDRVKRIDTWLQDYCFVKDTPYVRGVSWLIFFAAVGRAMEPGIKYDVLVVLEGPQGVGKSTLVDILGGPYALEGLAGVNLNDKDVVSRLVGKWIIEIDELEVARKADTETLKSFLSRTVDVARPAYGKVTRDYPRRCIFIATTNKHVYLKDETGNRRFLPIQIEKAIDLVGLRKDRDQLFAEAVHMWNARPAGLNKIELPRHLWKDAGIEQLARKMENPWVDSISDYLNGDEDEEKIDIITSKQLLDGALGKAPAQQTRNDWGVLHEIMKSLGWVHGSHRDPKKKGKVIKGYKRPHDVTIPPEAKTEDDEN